jgi:hypothetical protein
MTAKDWLTIPMSMAALCVSITVAYLTLRQTDDVRLILGHIGNSIGTRVTAKGTVAVWANHDATFINSGNRAAAVTFVRLKIFGGWTGPPTDCNVDMFVLEYDFEPFVIRPGEIILRKLQLNAKQLHGEVKDGMVYMQFAEIEGESANFIFCISVNVLTPDNLTEEITTRLFVETSPSNPDDYPTREYFYSGNTPIHLVPPGPESLVYLD